MKRAYLNIIGVFIYLVFYLIILVLVNSCYPFFRLPDLNNPNDPLSNSGSNLSAPVYFTVPTKTINMDGLNTSGEWDNASCIYFKDAEGDDPTSYTGLDLKNIRLYQDDSYLYIYIDFYDGVPNSTWTNGQGLYRIDIWLDTSENPVIKEFDVGFNGSLWTVGSQYETLTNTSVAVNQVIEIKTPKSAVVNLSYFYVSFVDWGPGGDDAWVYSHYDYSISPRLGNPDNATRIILSN